VDRYLMAFQPSYSNYSAANAPVADFRLEATTTLTTLCHWLLAG
jgi:hypothetical protein